MYMYKMDHILDHKTTFWKVEIIMFSDHIELRKKVITNVFLIN